MPGPGNSNGSAFGMRFCKRLARQVTSDNTLIHFIFHLKNVFSILRLQINAVARLWLAIQVLTWQTPLFILFEPIFENMSLEMPCANQMVTAFSMKSHLWWSSYYMNIYVCVNVCMCIIYTYASVLGIFVFMHMYNRTKILEELHFLHCYFPVFFSCFVFLNNLLSIMGIEAFYYHFHVSQFQISLTFVHNGWMDNKLELVHVIALIWLQTIISMAQDC